MVTNRDIEIAFVRAQQRINDQIDIAQTEFYLPELSDFTDILVKQANVEEKSTNPLVNEEI